MSYRHNFLVSTCYKFDLRLVMNIKIIHENLLKTKGDISCIETGICIILNKLT